MPDRRAPGPGHVALRCSDMRDLLYRWAGHPEYEEAWKP